MPVLRRARDRGRRQLRRPLSLENLRGDGARSRCYALARTLHRPVAMRPSMWVLLALTGACAVDAVDAVGPDGPRPDPERQSGGGLPAPRCGTPCEEAGQCVGCGYSSHLCFGDVAFFTLGSGSCTADGAEGADAADLRLEIDGTAIAADRAGAAIVSSTLELVVHAGQHRLSILAPAAPGTYNCASSLSVVVQYTSPQGERAANRPVAGRLPCSITVASVGAVGQRVTGSLSAQVPTSAGTVVLSAAAFSVVRVPSP